MGEGLSPHGLQGVYPSSVQVLQVLYVILKHIFSMGKRYQILLLLNDAVEFIHVPE